MKFLTIDRFENNYALCEDAEKRMFAIERAEVPAGAKEGDVLRISVEGVLSIDAEETKRRREKVKKLQNGLWK